LGISKSRLFLEPFFLIFAFQFILYNLFVILWRTTTVAVSATARKLATILWNMLYKNQHYNPPTVYEYLDQKRNRKVIELQKQIANLDARMSDIKPA